MASALLQSPDTREFLKQKRDVLLFYDQRTEDYDFLLRAQGGRCAICRTQPQSERKLCVDHDHQTGIVRGLLCDRCNLGLGHLENYIGAALRYVIKSAPRAHKYGTLRSAQAEMKRIMADARRASKTMAQLISLQEELEKRGIGFSFKDIEIPGRLGFYSAQHIREYENCLAEMEALNEAVNRTQDANKKLLGFVCGYFGIQFEEDKEEA